MSPSDAVPRNSEKTEEYEQCMKKYDDVTCKKILEAKN
jgi:hypothetical protein